MVRQPAIELWPQQRLSQPLIGTTQCRLESGLTGSGRLDGRGGVAFGVEGITAGWSAGSTAVCVFDVVSRPWLSQLKSILFTYNLTDAYFWK